MSSDDIPLAILVKTCTKQRRASRPLPSGALYYPPPVPIRAIVESIQKVPYVSDYERQTLIATIVKNGL